MTTSDRSSASALGAEVRRRRESAGLSLRSLARMADLSPSFVSRMERGLAQPRLESLHRVATALGTSAQALLSGDAPVTTYSLVRADDETLPISETPRAGVARSLVRGRRTLTALEMTQYSTEFGATYEHPGEELFIVARGAVEVELDGELLVLRAGDTLCYSGHTPHRSRALDGEDPVVFLVTSRPDEG